MIQADTSHNKLRQLECGLFSPVVYTFFVVEVLETKLFFFMNLSSILIYHREVIGSNWLRSNLYS